LLQCAEQTLGRTGTVVTDAENFVHGGVQNLVGKIRNKEKLG
jgi:predicted GTPase